MAQAAIEKIDSLDQSAVPGKIDDAAHGSFGEAVAQGWLEGAAVFEGHDHVVKLDRRALGSNVKLPK
jgi:hypothetical protein